MEKKQIVSVVVLVFLLLIATIGISFSYFSATFQNGETTTTITLKGGIMGIDYFDKHNIITINNAFPSSAPIASKLFTLTGTNTTDLTMEYYVALVVESNTFSNNALSYKLTSMNTSSSGTIIPSITTHQSIHTGKAVYYLGNGQFVTGSSKVHTYTLELYWLETTGDQRNDQGKEMKGYIDVKEEASIKTIGIGNLQIDYDTNMIPVAYNTSGQTVKADITNNDVNYKWYDYCQSTDSVAYNYNINCGFRWANAVLVKESGINSREAYKKVVPGSIIEESDILAYFVYVPRYKYQIFNVDFTEVPEQTINIVFENKSQKTNAAYQMNKALASIGDWMTHPGFTFGTLELNGIWFGKFETTGTVSNPTIKPNLSSVRGNRPEVQFSATRLFTTTETFGLYRSPIDSHQVKQTEWGATAYLSHSIYGKKGNHNFSSLEKFVALNNSSGFFTGRSAGYPTGNANILQYQEFFDIVSGPTVTYGTAGYYAWDDSEIICTGTCTTSNAAASNYGFGTKEARKGTAASTTGTQYGIYDMSGGANEYVMGNYTAAGVSAPGPLSYNEANFGGWLTSELPTYYYDSYNGSGGSAFSTRCRLGDAVGEVRNWPAGGPYSLPGTNDRWIHRGGKYNDAGAGIFASFGYGPADSYYGYRSALIMK